MKVYRRRVPEDYHAIQFDGGNMEHIQVACSSNIDYRLTGDDKWRLYVGMESFHLRIGHWIVWAEDYFSVWPDEEFRQTFEEAA